MATGSKKGACSAHVEAAKSNCLQHNRREGHVPSYVNPNLTSTNRTVYEDDVIKTRKSIVPLVKRAELEYTQKTGQKCQKSFTPYREDVLKLKHGITDEQLMDFKAKAEALTGWKVIGIWLHQDEGYERSKYIEGDEDYDINYHAHVLYDCVDHTTGKAIRPQRKYFSIRQDLLAESTGMERGNKAAETGIRHRQSAKQRAMAQEQRIAELERIAKEREQQHQAELKRMAEERKKAVEDARKKATASVWHKVKDVFGADGTINDLKAQNQALQTQIANERENHKAELKKARQSAQKPLQDALGRIARLMAYFPSKLTIDGVIEKINDHLKAERLWRSTAQRADEQLKAIKREQNQEQLRSGRHM